MWLYSHMSATRWRPHYYFGSRGCPEGIHYTCWKRADALHGKNSSLMNFIHPKTPSVKTLFLGKAIHLFSNTIFNYFENKTKHK